MGWYRTTSRFRFNFDVFRRYNSKIVVARNPNSRTKPLTSSSMPNFSGKFFTNTALQNGLKQSQWDRSLLDGAKRYYCVDRNGVHQFNPRRAYKQSKIIRNLLIVNVIGIGIAIIKLYFGNTETVPFTNRTRFAVVSSAQEKELVDYEYKEKMSQFEGKILPPLHPESIRVQIISQDIIGALQKGLMKEQEKDDETMNALAHSMGEEGKWEGEDKWVEQSRKTGEDEGKKSHTAHLEGLNWEVIVVDHPQIYAFCLPGGKIVVYTGLLEYFRADAEIATVIGHEIHLGLLKFVGGVVNLC